MSFNAWIIAGVIIAIYYVVPIIFFCRCRDDSRRHKFSVILLILYLITLTIGVWAEVKIKNGRVLITFDYGFSQQKTISWGFSGIKLLDILINLGMLVPLGVIFSVNCRKTVFCKQIIGLLIGLAIGTVIEVGQFLLPVERTPQLSDVLFNLLGMGFGCLIGELLNKNTQHIGN